MRMADLRTYGMAALRYYDRGKLVEDVTDDYLTTAQGTLPPAPASVNLVDSPQALVREIQQGHALVYAQAHSLDLLFNEGLRWMHQYDAPNVFVSDGPMIHAWPACHRIGTLGAEAFVTSRSLMPAFLALASNKGLKEVRLYNGRELFRRFLLHGAKRWEHLLLLDPRWSAGLYQKAGYCKGDYGTGTNRYRPLGLDREGRAYVPLHGALADRTHCVIGHPVVAGKEGTDLFIQVTHLSDNPQRWHVSVNNPTDRPIAATLRKAIALPGLDVPERPIVIAPGEITEITR